jgi:hypothetical protein
MSTPQWVTDRAPAAGDLDIKGMIQIPAQPSNLADSRGRAVELNCWHPGIPWRHTKIRRAQQPGQLQLPNDVGESCSTCRYWLKWAKPGGECRRNAPQSVLLHADVDDADHIAYWPGTDNADWCGEWEAKP